MECFPVMVVEGFLKGVFEGISNIFVKKVESALSMYLEETNANHVAFQNAC